MSVVDMLVVGTLAVGLVLGLIRGFIPQVVGIAGFLGGILLAGRYYGPLKEDTLDPAFTSDWNGEIAFLSIVFVTVLVAWFIGWVVQKLIDKMQLGAYDRLMGAVFGTLKAGLICAGLLLGVVYFVPNGGGIEQAISQSRSGPMLWTAMRRVAGVLPDRMRGDVETFLTDHDLPRTGTAGADAGGE